MEEQTVGNNEKLIVRGNYADPSIIRVEEDYYMVHSSYQYIPGLIIWHSQNLVDWKPIGAALTSYFGNVWAPEFVYYKGEFSIYFPSNRMNWVTKAKNPRGPWSKPVPLHLPHIDPGHIVDEVGRRYLHLSGGHVVPIDEEGIHIQGEVKKVYDHWKYPKDWVVEGESPEGPKLIRKGKYYYYTLAIGGTSGPPTSHMVVSSRSTTPIGPWEHSPYNPIIKTMLKDEKWWSKGHGTLIDTVKGDWYIVYHAYANHLHTIGRQTLLSEVEWMEDDWFRVKSEMKIPDTLNILKQDSIEEDNCDVFTDEKRFLSWQWLRSISDYRYIYHKGAPLTILGATDKADYSPMLYMAKHRNYKVTVEVEVIGEAELEFLLYYDSDHYVGVGCSANGVRVLRPYKRVGKTPFNRSRIVLKIDNHDNIVSFYYRGVEDKKWTKYDKVLDTSGMNHNTLGGFLSLRPGLEVVGKGKVHVYQFKYKAINS
ncbi:family 43 glycosylhydrolase [Salipaludibacillus sp. HK11]|uniref:family 43 glycosylhydrolase n=1 Tax=Salipaludibacillus sp. HK11 TaxID=3394320 RepID=UPI0039FDB5CE